MTIGAYGTAAAASARATATYQSIKSDSSVLETQLSTGKTSQTYAGLGANAATALRLEGKLSTLSAYSANVTDATLRVKVAGTGLQAITKLSSTLGTSLTGTALPTDSGRQIVQATAVDGLKQVIDVLNSDVAGRYLFSGRAADTQPVASYDEIVNGDSTHAGLSTLITQRKAADAGSDGLGRLTLATTGSTVTLGEQAAGLPFGLKLGSVTASGTGNTATGPSGSPAQVSIAVGSQPVAGDTLSVALNLPDGSSQTVTLTAGGTAGGGTTPFAIGATPADTAANIQAALATAISGVTSSTLPAASALKASTDFFASTAASPPQRVAGPPYDTATSFVAGTSDDTVIWYRGDASSSPRDGAPVRIGDSQTIGIGAQANESGFQSVLASFAAVAADTFASTDSTTSARFAAIASRVAPRLSPSDNLGPVSAITVDFSQAASTLSTAGTRLSGTTNQIQDTLDGIETADPTEVATKLLATQTRLQASYQTTATIAKLSLVDYL